MLWGTAGGHLSFRPMQIFTGMENLSPRPPPCAMVHMGGEPVQPPYNVLDTGGGPLLPCGVVLWGGERVAAPWADELGVGVEALRLAVWYKRS